MAKTILPPGSYTYNAAGQQVDFTNFTDVTGQGFDFTRLYAIIDVKAGQIIYTTAGASSGYGGSYSAPILNLNYDTTPYSGYIDLQIIYDLTSAPTAIYDGTGTQPILSTTDSITGREGLDINLLSSSFGGQLTLPLPSYTTSGYNAALSVGFINGGNLVAPNMDAMTNNLIVDINSFPSTGSSLPVTITGSSIIQSTSLDYWQGNPVSYTSPPPFMLTSPAAGPAAFNQGSSDAYTLRTASNQYTSSGANIDYGSGQVSAGTTRTTAIDYTVSGVSSTVLNINILTGSSASFVTDGYKYALIQINSTATGGAYIFEGSNDNLNFFNIPVYNSLNPTTLPILGNISATVSSIPYTVPISVRWLRVRISTALTGGSAITYSRFSQTVPPLLFNLGASQYNAASNPAVDVLNVPMSASKYNQIEISFDTAPSASLITQTTAGGATITQANGHSLFTTGTATTASAKAVTVASIVYRPANEIYSYFTASFTTPTSANSYQRIGMYDTNNGFFIGYNGTNFGITKRTATVDTFTIRTSWNGDPLDGSSSSKFTRNGTPEAINLTLSNLFRIRFAWLGSANILFDVFSPDGVWVNFHNIKQPNSALNPSVTVHDLPITLDIAKTAADATSLVMATACWAGGTTSPYSPITATLTDNSLAGLTRSVITGVTTGGGGGYVNVKVNPSGALVGDFSNSTGLGISSSALPTGASTSALQTSGNAILTSMDASLTSINTKTPALGAALTSASTPVNIAYDQIVTMGPNGQAVFGSISALNGSTTVNVNGYTACVIDLRGTFTATVTFQGTIDGTNWIALNAIPYGSAQNIALVSTSTVAGAWLVQCAGCTQVRATATAYTSGTITTVLRATPATSWTYNAPVGASNSVAIASGTVTTVSTVTGVTTVSSVTSDNLASSTITDIASAAITTTTTSANLATTNIQSVAFQVSVTATSGTGQTLDIVIQETMDGTNYYDIYHFERITATGQYYSPVMKLAGIGIRYVRTVAGTTPSFTMSGVRINRSGNAPTMRRLFDRTIAPNTLGSTTPVMITDGCDEIQITVSMASGGTVSPVFGLQASEDNVNWCNFQSSLVTITGAPSTTACVAGTIGYLPKYIRGYVATAGVGSAINWVCLKSKGA